jgi:hypothetical protein
MALRVSTSRRCASNKLVLVRRELELSFHGTEANQSIDSNTAAVGEAEAGCLAPETFIQFDQSANFRY